MSINRSKRHQSFSNRREGATAASPDECPHLTAAGEGSLLTLASPSNPQIYIEDQKEKKKKKKKKNLDLESLSSKEKKETVLETIVLKTNISKPYLRKIS